MMRKALMCMAALALSQLAIAEDSLAGRLRACAAVPDDAARLTCYDAAAETVMPAAAVAPPAPEPVPEPVPEPAPAPAPAPAAEAPLADPVEVFGMTAELEAKKGGGKVDEELREVSAIVVEVSKRSRGQHVVTLDNGQTWTEKDAEPYFRVKVGDSVTIKRNRMGGYRMVGRGNRASAVVRVE